MILFSSSTDPSDASILDRRNRAQRRNPSSTPPLTCLGLKQQHL
jgi:hypothetical protein